MFEITFEELEKVAAAAAAASTTTTTCAVRPSPIWKRFLPKSARHRLAD
jgi:hypothetical protein